jgi:phosphoribosylamine-glycine ligase
MNKVSNFLILSEGGDGSGLAMRLKDEGHDVKIWIRDPEAEKRCKGLVDQADSYSFGQTVVADCTGLGSLLDTYKEGGIPTVGGSSFADKLECDREYAEEVFHTVGIDTPKSEKASTWEEAAELIAKLGGETGRIVLKPEGRFSGVIPSYVSEDLEDGLKMLAHFKSQIGEGEVELVVQEFLEGVAISTEGWFTGQDWVSGMFNHTIERKQFLNDDLGPCGGCTGNLVWGCDSEDPLVRELLTPLTDVLKEYEYRGAIDVNAVVNEEGAYALEFTPRFGYDAFPTLLTSLCNFNFGRFLDAVARGYDCSEYLTEGFGAGVRLSLAPWPSEKFHAEERIPIAGMGQRSLEWFYPYDVQLSQEGELESSGGYGILGVVNGFGSSIDDAFDSAYSILKRCRIPGKQYRTDLAEACKKDFKRVAKLVEESVA